MQRPSPHAYSLPTVKTPNQSHFLTFSNHFRPAWEACPNLPREPYYMSKINKSFHTLLVYVWHHQFRHWNRLLGGNPFCFRRGATTSVLLICSSLIPSFSLAETEALIFCHLCGAQRDACLKSRLSKYKMNEEMILEASLWSNSSSSQTEWKI